MASARVAPALGMLIALTTLWPRLVKYRKPFLPYPTIWIGFAEPFTNSSALRMSVELYGPERPRSAVTRIRQTFLISLFSIRGWEGRSPADASEDIKLCIFSL